MAIFERRFATAQAANDPDFEAAELAIGSYKADGLSYSYVLSDLDLG